MKWGLELIKGKFGYLTGVKYKKTKRLRWDDFEVY